MTQTLSPTTAPAPDIDHFKPYYKRHRYLHRSEIQSDPDILDPCGYSTYCGGYTITSQNSPMSEAWLSAVNEFLTPSRSESDSFINSYSTLHINELPGLQIISGLLSDKLQQQLIHDTITEYLPPKEHLTNLDVHYDLPRPLDIFDDSIQIPHKLAKPSLDMSLLRSKKLRWVTLGGQYNWTTKIYPSMIPGSEGFPHFPPRLAKLLKSIFDINSQAAIVNFYSPGDILSPHQDVAELAKADLVSISLGCDCVFYVGKTRDSKPLPILLRSGDIIVMGGESRFAFHGVGRVWPDTCPSFITDYNPKDLKPHLYKPWVSNKRININIRQMF